MEVLSVIILKRKTRKFLIIMKRKCRFIFGTASKNNSNNKKIHWKIENYKLNFAL